MTDLVHLTVPTFFWRKAPYTYFVAGLLTLLSNSISFRTRDIFISPSSSKKGNTSFWRNLIALMDFSI